MGRGMEKFDCLLPAAESKATKESSAALFGSKYGLAQASTIYLGSLPPSCQSMTRQLLAVLLVTAAAQEISETQARDAQVCVLQSRSVYPRDKLRGDKWNPWNACEPLRNPGDPLRHLIKLNFRLMRKRTVLKRVSAPLQSRVEETTPQKARIGSKCNCMHVMCSCCPVFSVGKFWLCRSSFCQTSAVTVS